MMVSQLQTEANPIYGEQRMSEELTQERLKELFEYQPETGLLINKVFRNSKALAGMEAGTIGGHGYRMVRIDWKPYHTHRLIWLYHYGKWPTHQIDHINGDKLDNRLENLRDVDQAENLKNRKIQSNNTSGTPGVSWNKSDQKWYASIKVNGKTKNLGSFKEKERAIALRKAAEIDFGYHPNHGRKA